MNREQMLKAVLRGYAVIANDQPIAPSSRFYNASCRSAPYDPEKAKCALAEGRHARPRRSRSWPPTAATTSLDMAVVLQQAARQDRLQPRRAARAGGRLLVELLAEGAVHFGNINPRPNARHPVLAVLQVRRALEREPAGRTRSSTRCCSRRAASGCRQAQGRSTATCRRWCATRRHGIPVFISQRRRAHPKLKGLEPNPLGGMMGYAFAEYVWLES